MASLSGLRLFRSRRWTETWLLSLILLALALAARTCAMLHSGVVLGEGDWSVYARVAQNIVSGCGVSMSPPDAQVCVPHFGGNGLPGYPAFIALVWFLFGTSKAAVLWAQVVVCSLAVPRVVYGASRMAGRTAGLICGVLAALSPLQVFTVRVGLAEALSIACVNWLLAELMLSVADRRLRYWPIACALVVGIFLRLDFVVFSVPVAVVGIWIHGWVGAIRRGVIVVVLVSIPLGLWTARNVAVGIPILPPARNWMLPDGTQGPLGYLAWLKKWVTTQDQRSAAMFFETNHFDKIHILPSRFRPADQDAKVDGLLADLRSHDGQPFPADIDRAFASLAAETARDHGIGDNIDLIAMRTVGVWRNWAEPLPPELYPGGDTLSLGTIETWVSRSLTSGLGALVNTATRVYRLALGLCFIVALVFVRRGTEARRVVTLAAGSAVVAKTVLCVAVMALEARYTLTLVPFMETAVGLSTLEAVRYLARSRGYRSSEKRMAA
jgi:hypothetical protein